MNASGLKASVARAPTSADAADPKGSHQCAIYIYIYNYIYNYIYIYIL